MSEPMRRRSPFPLTTPKVETTTPTPPADGERASIPEPSAPAKPIEPAPGFADVKPTDPLDDAPWRRLPDPTPVAPNGLSHYCSEPSDTAQTTKGEK